MVWPDVNEPRSSAELICLREKSGNTKRDRSFFKIRPRGESYSPVLEAVSTPGRDGCII